MPDLTTTVGRGGIGLRRRDWNFGHSCERSPLSAALFWKGMAVRATEPPIDTGTAAGKAFLGMLGKQAK
jgi:hypothetical protein